MKIFKPSKSIPKYETFHDSLIGASGEYFCFVAIYPRPLIWSSLQCKGRARLSNMYLFMSVIVCTFLVLNVFAANGVLSIHSDKQCGVLENVVHKQEYLEKKVEAHDKILGGESCTEGTTVVNVKENR